MTKKEQELKQRRWARFLKQCHWFTVNKANNLYAFGETGVYTKADQLPGVGVESKIHKFVPLTMGVKGMSHGYADVMNIKSVRYVRRYVDRTPDGILVVEYETPLRRKITPDLFLYGKGIIEFLNTIPDPLDPSIRESVREAKRQVYEELQERDSASMLKLPDVYLGYRSFDGTYSTRGQWQLFKDFCAVYLLHPAGLIETDSEENMIESIVDSNLHCEKVKMIVLPYTQSHEDQEDMDRILKMMHRLPITEWKGRLEPTGEGFVVVEWFPIE